MWKKFLSLPKTRLGWWSVRLAATSVVLFAFGYGLFEVLAVEVPWEGVIITLLGIAMLSCGLAGGIVGLRAIVRRHERSWLAWLAMVPGLAALVFLIGEVLGRW
jgi:hypothetical protein